MMRERGQYLRAANKFFEHLRWGFAEVGLHGDAADAGPLLLSAENVMHEVTELVEEHGHVSIFHQACIGGGGCGEITDQSGFGHLFAADSVENLDHLGVAELAGAGMHVEIKA